MKGRRSKAQLFDIPIVLDSCGVDVNDPIGAHVVNFTFSLHAIEDPENPFDGELDFSFPYTQGKGAKLPKIDLNRPETQWNSTFPVTIDDNLISQIKDKNLIYKITFMPRVHLKTARGLPKKGQEKNITKVQNPTIFFDASILFVRGGRFKQTLHYSHEYSPKGFSKFEFSLDIDKPLLSDAQIRKHLPFVCYIKGIHQMPNSPIPFEQLRNTYNAPYLVIKDGTQTHMTIPYDFQSDIKTNIALMLWGSSTAMEIELHDREYNFPELVNVVGSSYLLPDTPSKAPDSVGSLSIETILGVKKDTITIPFGIAKTSIEPKRILVPFAPVVPRDTMILPALYVESGTYVTIEMESLVQYVPKMAPPPTPTTSSPQRNRGMSIKAKKEKDAPHDLAPLFFNRIVCVVDYALNSERVRKFVSLVQEQIIVNNQREFKAPDISTVSTMKCTKPECSAITGFIFIIDQLEIMIFELLADSQASQSFHTFINRFEQCDNIKVLSDINKKFPAPRLYNEFDCAVKKLKLSCQLKHILADPEIYIKNTHISPCFTVTNQLNLLTQVKTFEEVVENHVWPSYQDLELLNAKRGQILTMSELVFPPRYGNLPNCYSKINLPRSALNAAISAFRQFEEPTPVFKYIPLNQELIDDPPKDYKYYAKKNRARIKKIERSRPKTAGLIKKTGDVELWAVKDESIIQEEGYVLEKPEVYEPLASRASDRVYFSNMREENGTEIKNGERFSSMLARYSALEPIEELKTDKNFVPWGNRDSSLANADTQWLATTRGPDLSDFRNVVAPKDTFNQPDFMPTEYHDRPSTTNPDFLTKGIKHRKKFNRVVTPVKKNEPLCKNKIEPLPLTVLEPYKDFSTDKTRKKTVTRGKQRFKNVFPETIAQEGESDSPTVRRFKPNIPRIIQGF